VGGRSFCDFCGRQLNWYDNVPVISWLVLGGKSRCCGKKLPKQYPIVEMGMGILFCITYKTELEIGVSLMMVTLLIFAVVFDLKHMILPDFSTYILIILAAIFWHNWAAGIGSFLFLLLLHVGTKGKGMGFGDVKLALFMGLFLGWPKIILAYYIAFVVGSVIGLLLILLKKKKKNSMIPFGPFLILGTMIAYWWGDSILYYIYGWF